MPTSRISRCCRWLVATLAGLLAATGVASAHVRYVTDTEDVGEGLQFLASALTDPVNAGVIGGTGLLTVIILLVYLRVQPFQRDIEVFREAMREYSDLLPWLLRLGFGLPLVGAGFAGYLFNPVVDANLVNSGAARLFQIGLGFALLFGLATRVTAVVGLVAYLLTLAIEPVVLFSMEWVPGFIAIALIGGGRPSADEVFQRVADAEGTMYGDIDPIHDAARRLNQAVDPYERYVPTVIRVGMGISFAFLGVFEKLLAPQMAISVVRQYGLDQLIPVSVELWVLGAGFAELALGTAIAVGLFTRLSALTAMSVFTLTLFGIPDDPVLAHIGLFSLASALLITGAGPYALDDRIGAATPELPRIRERIAGT
ncbi:MAG: putative membrane protein YphA (DoxX/SURF4 family) [Natronomonas sp.]|jgi:uncharacterized membrane protein YphA (DoxX/SURF4 family)|uniref:DoxX family protein n=1 Tax=Natronomonas sp. TaxID=2184060 RepID=UPI003989EC7B